MSSRVIISVFVCIIIGVSFLIFGLSSCGPELVPPPSPPDPCDILEAKSNSLKANIYIDCSGSMQGFVNPQREISYKKIVASLEVPLIKGWTAPLVTFYKFSEKLEKLLGRTYRELVNPPPYTGKMTKIQLAFDCVDADCLNIVLTDLIQSDEDTMRLIEILKNKINKQKARCDADKHDGKNLDISIGVLGIKSLYKKKENSEIIARPFYMIMVGKHLDIINYYELMKQSNSITDEMGFSILSKHLVENIFPTPDLIPPSVNIIKKTIIGNSPHEKDRDKDLDKSQDIIYNSIPQLRIKDRNKEAKFALKFDYNTLSYIVPFKLNDVKPKITAEIFRQQKFVEYGQDNISIESDELLDKSYSLKIKVLPKKLPKGTYRYKFVLTPSGSAYINPPWWSGWDTELVDEMSKTKNLNRFMDSLWQAMVQIYQPQIAEFYCYIKVG